jgi:hypothetical protein
MSEETDTTKAGAVELEEHALDEASGGVSKIDALTIKQTVGPTTIKQSVVRDQIGLEGTP